MKRVVLALLVVSVICTAAAAQVLTLAKIYDVVRDTRGNVVSQANVAVYEQGTTTLAPLYQSPTILISRSNPLTTNEKGEFWAYVMPGRYDLAITRAGFETQTITDRTVVAYLPDLPAPLDLRAMQSGTAVNLLWSQVSGAGYYRLLKASKATGSLTGGSYEVVAPAILDIGPEIRPLLPPTDAYGAIDPIDFTIFWEPNERRFHVIYTNNDDLESAALAINRLGHSSSADLVYWTHHDPILVADMQVDGYRIDMMWAPHVILHDNKWRMFYTGVDRTDTPDENGATAIQSIFYAEAPYGADLRRPDVWEGHKYLFNGVTTGTPWTAYGALTGPTYYKIGEDFNHSCRDPFVMEHDGVWYVFATVGKDSLETAVGVARANNVDGPYTLLGYLDIAGGGDHAESPIVFHVEQTEGLPLWYVLFSDGTKYKVALKGGQNLLHPDGYSYVGDTTFNVAEILRGPFGPYLDVIPSTRSGVESWFLAHTRHGTLALPQPIGFSSLWYDASATPTALDWRLGMLRMIQRTPLGVFAANNHIDRNVLWGRTYSYRVASGLSNQLSDVQTVEVQPQAMIELDFVVKDLEGFWLRYSIVNYPWPRWQSRYKAVFDTTEVNPYVALAGVAWGAWSELTAFGTVDLPNDEQGITEGSYHHFMIEARAENSPNAEFTNGYDSRIVVTYTGEDQHRGDNHDPPGPKPPRWDEYPDPYAPPEE